MKRQVQDEQIGITFTVDELKSGIGRRGRVYVRFRIAVFKKERKGASNQCMVVNDQILHRNASDDLSNKH